MNYVNHTSKMTGFWLYLKLGSSSEPARSARPEFELASELSQLDGSLEGVRGGNCVGAWQQCVKCGNNVCEVWKQCVWGVATVCGGVATVCGSCDDCRRCAI